MSVSAPPSALGRITAKITGADQPKVRSRHRDVSTSPVRAAVLGAGDGLLTNLSLVIGVAGGTSAVGAVRLAGVAGLLAGAFSMAAGELVSVKAQEELVQRELAVESSELKDEPEEELAELTMMYRKRGVPAEDAATVARILSATHELALDTHSRLELGINPDQTSSALKAALASFLSFGIGAVIPLFPWFFLGSSTALVLSMVLGGLAAFGLGGAIGAFTGRGIFKTGMRQLVAAAVAAAVTYGVGAALGISAG